MLAKFTSQMHGAERVLKPAMLRRRIDPAGTLQLINIAQTLHPRRIDERLFSYLAFVFRHGELDVAVSWVMFSLDSAFQPRLSEYWPQSSNITWAVQRLPVFSMRLL